MEVKVKHPRSRFRKTVLASAMGLLGAMSIAQADTKSWGTTTSYLDPAVWTKEVHQEQCFQASPRALLVVEPIQKEGVRVYKVSQFFDVAIEKRLYAQTIDQQVQAHKIVGRKFCRGIVSISNLDVPFPKGETITDVNDGVLLAGSLRQGLAKIQDQLQQITSLASQAASGIYSSTQLVDLNHDFQAELAEVDTLAQNTQFNGIKLLNGKSKSIKVPVDNSKKMYSVVLPNMTTGTSGLNIKTLDIASNANAEVALSQLITSISTVITATNNAAISEHTLGEAVSHNEITTLVDVTTDQFVVQHQKQG